MLAILKENILKINMLLCTEDWQDFFIQTRGKDFKFVIRSMTFNLLHNFA